MEGSNDGTTWTLIENVTAFDFALPLQRQTGAQFIPFPGPSLIPQSFRILSSTIGTETNQIRLTWESMAGATYRITASGNLIDWSPLKTGIVGAPDSTTEVAELTPAPKQFFRVELE